MEVTIANRHCNSFDFLESKKNKAEFKGNVELSKNSTKEAMFIFKVEPARITGRAKLEEKRSASVMDVTRRHPTIKEL